MNRSTNLKDFYKNKKVLVTGGAGFIGSNLVDKLVELESDVTVIDNFSTGNIDNLKASINKIHLIPGDIRCEKTCKLATKDKEVIFHLAAISTQPLADKNPKICNDVNVKGTLNLLRSTENHLKAFTFSSTSAIYGPTNETCHEQTKINPISSYAISKRDAEEICLEMQKKLNIRVSILRYFNVFGLRQNQDKKYANVIERFRQSILTNTELTIYGDGRQTRDFVDVKKVVMANLITSAFGPNNFDVYNIASGKSVNLIKIINTLELVLNKKAHRIKLKKPRQNDIINSIANCEKYDNLVKSLNLEDDHGKPVCDKTIFNFFTNSP